MSRSPGTSNNIENVISVGTATSRGTKGCNACHGDAGMKANVGEPQLSERIEAFGTIDDPQNARNPSFIIDTDDCQVQEKINGLPLGNLNGVGVKKQTLAEICDCIDMAAIGGTVTAQVKNLCQELENYQKTGAFLPGLVHRVYHRRQRLRQRAPQRPLPWLTSALRRAKMAALF